MTWPADIITTAIAALGLLTAVGALLLHIRNARSMKRQANGIEKQVGLLKHQVELMEKEMERGVLEDEREAQLQIHELMEEHLQVTERLANPEGGFSDKNLFAHCRAMNEIGVRSKDFPRLRKEFIETWGPLILRVWTRPLFRERFAPYKSGDRPGQYAECERLVHECVEAAGQDHPEPSHEDPLEPLRREYEERSRKRIEEATRPKDERW